MLIVVDGERGGQPTASNTIARRIHSRRQAKPKGAPHPLQTYPVGPEESVLGLVLGQFGTSRVLDPDRADEESILSGLRIVPPSIGRLRARATKHATSCSDS